MYITVNGLRLFYTATGQGTPLIMLHGNGETHEIFDRAIPILAKYHTVYAVDARGHGQSDPVKEYHYDDIAEDMRCLIGALSLNKPVFYGFSDGGIVGLLLAFRYPDLLSRLIVSGANLNPEGIRPGWLWLFRKIFQKTGDAKMRMMLEEPNITPEQLSRITVPTAVLAGGRDMVLRSHTRLIASCVPGSTLQILPLYGHGSYIVHRRKIAHLILDIEKV